MDEPGGIWELVQQLEKTLCGHAAEQLHRVRGRVAHFEVHVRKVLLAQTLRLFGCPVGAHLLLLVVWVVRHPGGPVRQQAPRLVQIVSVVDGDVVLGLAASGVAVPATLTLRPSLRPSQKSMRVLKWRALAAWERVTGTRTQKSYTRLGWT